MPFEFSNDFNFIFFYFQALKRKKRYDRQLQQVNIKKFINISLIQTPIHRLIQVYLKYNFIHIPLSKKSGLFISYTHAQNKIVWS